MNVKLLNLNIFQGKFLDRIIDFVKKEDFDILHFQEVTGGKMSKGGTYSFPEEMKISSGISNINFLEIDCFQTLKEGLNYTGELIKTLNIKKDKNSYYGNATLFKKSLILSRKKTLWFNEYKEIDEDDRRWEEVGRCALILEFNIDGKNISFINTHLAWGPNPDDADYKLKQAKILYEYIKTLKAPFVLTGDFNVAPSSQIVKWFDELGKNHVASNSVVTTLNPRVHPAKNLFPPGIVVDYTFTHPSIMVRDFKVINDIDLSDHFGLSTEIEI